MQIFTRLIYSIIQKNTPDTKGISLSQITPISLEANADDEVEKKINLQEEFKKMSREELKQLLQEQGFQFYDEVF